MMKKSAQRQRRKSGQPTSAPTPTDTPAPQWVVSMREYYQRTGLYRAEDLNRVLGDPRQQVVMEPIDGLLVACKVQK